MMKHSRYNINNLSIKLGAINEAAYTLTDAFLSMKQGFNDQPYLSNLFKNMINTASIQSRDFAVQVEGCKGVLIWSDERSQPLFSSWSQQTMNISKYASKLLGQWSMKPFIKNTDKLRRKLMSNYPRHLIIGFVGVLSQEQNKGLGTALVEYIIDKADTCQYPIYVEAIDNKSVQFFEKLGFVSKGQCSISKEQVITPMVRLPLETQSPKTLQIRPGRRDSN